MSGSPLQGRALKVGLVLVVIAGLAVAWRLGLFEVLSEPRTTADKLVAMGPWGYLAFIAAYTLFQPFGVPGTVFIVAAPLIWPWHEAFALSMTGTMAASIVGFAFARFVARDWVTPRIPERLRRYDERLERHAFQTVVFLRLLLWMPQVLHFYFGISRVGFWTHFWGSIVGYIPPLLVVSYLGSEMFDSSGRIQPTAWPAMAGLVALSVAVAVVQRILERRRETSATKGQFGAGS